jgi:hypothetical protein
MTKTLKNKTKEDYGYSEDLKDYFFKTNSHLKKGSFQLQKRKEHYYWYFLLSSDGRDNKRRLKYLCKTFEGKNQDGDNSFQHSLQILVEKQTNDFQSKVMSNVRVEKLLDEYMSVLLKEENSEEGRMYETTQTLQNSIRRFDDFCKIKDVRFDDFENDKKLRDLIIDYLGFCKERELSRNTIKTYLKGVRQFLNWLCDGDIGRGILKSHSITSEFINKIYQVTRKDKRMITERNLKYEDEYYNIMYETCIDKVRDIYTDYCENGLNKKSRYHTSGVGSDVVYFISLFQLYTGFRLGEILTSYRDKKYWMKRRDKKNSSTYWVRDNDVWGLYLDDFKGRDSYVSVELKIRTWCKTNNKNSKVVNDKNGKVLYYDTDLVDVCLEMFRENDFLFSSSNMNTHKNRHISKTYYMNIFKKILSNTGEKSHGWIDYGVKSSHNLRSYFITYMINMGYSIEDLCKITRHSVMTMWKYYKRYSENTQIDTQRRMDKSRVIRGVHDR